MASNFYSEIAPDYEDGDNTTGTRPGYLVEVVENDGGVGLSISLIKGDPRLNGDRGVEYRGIFLHVDDAQELLNGLRNAIERARPKNANHRWRVRDPD